MRRAVQALALLLLVLIPGGLGVCYLVGTVRRAAERTGCMNNLRQVGLALHNYSVHCRGRFPAGTVPNPALAPEKRLSWLVVVYPTYVENVPVLLDRAKAWDAPENCPPWQRVRVDDEGRTRDELLGDLHFLRCPSNPARAGPGMPGLTHYAGVAGVGERAAELPLSDRRAGFFGYDRTLTLEDIKDGASNTMTVAEVADGGPWTAGGRSTVRGLVQGGPPYLGVGGQFAGGHASTNVAFADGSVRALTSSVSPEVFEALATVAGGEEVGGWDG